MYKIALPIIVIIASIIIILQQVAILEQSTRISDQQAVTHSLQEQTTILYTELIDTQNLLRNVTEELGRVQFEKNVYFEQLTQNNASAPQQRISVSEVQLSRTDAIIRVPNLLYGIIAPTNSMLPVLREDAIVLEKIPVSPDELGEGDIIIYEFQDLRIIHRITSTGVDEQGWYARTKGDSNPYEDPQVVRFEQVRGVVVGIIY